MYTFVSSSWQWHTDHNSNLTHGPATNQRKFTCDSGIKILTSGKKFLQQTIFWMDPTPESYWKWIETNWTGKPKPSSDPTSRMKQNAANRLQSSDRYDKLTCSPKRLVLALSPPIGVWRQVFTSQNQHIPASYTWRRQNKRRGGRRLLTTYNNVRGTWFLSYVSKLSGRRVRLPGFKVHSMRLSSFSSLQVSRFSKQGF